MPFNEPEFVVLEPDEIKDLRHEVLGTLRVETETILAYESETPFVDHEYADRIDWLRELIACAAVLNITPAATTIGGRGVIAALRDVAAGCLELAWSEQNQIRWTWWASLAAKLGEDVEQRMPPPHPENDPPPTAPPG